MSEHASSGLLRSGVVVSGMTLLSRIAGLVRDLVIAVSFGAGPLTDAFFVAFRIPNLLRRLFGEGAVSHAVVPVLSETDAHGDETATRDLIAHVAGTLGGVLIAVSALGAVLAPVLVWVFAPGFVGDGERYDPAVAMLRICFPYVFFISLVAAAGAVLQSRGRFAVPAATPILLNLCMISAAIWLAPRLEQPIHALAVGVLVAGVVQLGFQLPSLARVGLLVMPVWGWRHAGTRKVMALLMPFVLSSGVYQFNALVSSVVASLMVAGSVSWLYYADRLLEFPHALIGVALGTVILPRLARVHQVADTDTFERTVQWALFVGLLLGLPAALGLAGLADAVIATLFQYGAFDHSDRHMAALALRVLALALPALIVIKVLTPAFSSRQDTRTPVRIAVGCMAVNMLGCVVLGVGLLRTGYAAPHIGLSAATVLSTLMQAGLLVYCLRHTVTWRLSRAGVRATVQLTVALAAMVLVLWMLSPDPSWWGEVAMRQRVLTLGGIIAASAAAYVTALACMGLRLSALRAVGGP
ncbi:MAG: murein biosynthesis integral membrane protein MurJ [Pseudomonadota bacterium]